MTYQSANPNDGKVLKSFEHLNSAQLESLQEFVDKKRVRTAHLDAPT